MKRRRYPRFVFVSSLIFLGGCVVLAFNKPLIEKIGAATLSSEASSLTIIAETSDVLDTLETTTETSNNEETQSTSTSETAPIASSELTTSTSSVTSQSRDSVSPSESRDIVSSTASVSEGIVHQGTDFSKPEVPKATKQSLSQQPKDAEQVTTYSYSKNQSTQEFIEAIGADAHRIAQKEQLYASVMIAQAILETGSGNSTLARAPHYNLFGIKGTYQGKKVTMATSEDNGQGQLYTIQAAFRAYPSYKESLEDYAYLLKNGISGNQSFYQPTWKSQAKTYQEATAYLTGHYATDTNYAQKLNALIETYDLSRYDQTILFSQKEPKETNEVMDTKKNKKLSENDLQEKNSETSQDDLSENQDLPKRTIQTIVPVSPEGTSWTKQPAKEVSGKQVIQSGRSNE